MWKSGVFVLGSTDSSVARRSSCVTACGRKIEVMRVGNGNTVVKV